MSTSYRLRESNDMGGTLLPEFFTVYLDLFGREDRKKNNSL
jgi:hypothetical protein